jgi:hypothetical protein
VKPDATTSALVIDAHPDGGSEVLLTAPNDGDTMRPTAVAAAIEKTIVGDRTMNTPGSWWPTEHSLVVPAPFR